MRARDERRKRAVAGDALRDAATGVDHSGGLGLGSLSEAEPAWALDIVASRGFNLRAPPAPYDSVGDESAYVMLAPFMDLANCHLRPNVEARIVASSTGKGEHEASGEHEPALLALVPAPDAAGPLAPGDELLQSYGLGEDNTALALHGGFTLEANINDRLSARELGVRRGGRVVLSQRFLSLGGRGAALEAARVDREEARAAPACERRRLAAVASVASAAAEAWRVGCGVNESADSSFGRATATAWRHEAAAARDMCDGARRALEVAEARARRARAALGAAAASRTSAAGGADAARTAAAEAYGTERRALLQAAAEELNAYVAEAEAEADAAEGTGNRNARRRRRWRALA